MRCPQRLWTPRTLLLLVLLVALNLSQMASLVFRAVHKVTDFTVFYNTGVLLARGAGPQLYAGRDLSTGWLRTIPPFGQMILQPLMSGGIRRAALEWEMVNALLLGASAATLWSFARRLDAKSRAFSANVPVFILILLALAPGSLQVGQFSVLFAACWIFFLGLSATRFRTLASAALAVPAGIKLYPLFLAGVFVVQRRWTAFALALFFAVSTVAAPYFVYGSRTFALTQSFWRNAIVGPNSRLNEGRETETISDQGIDGILQRYLTSNPRLDAKFPGFSHLDWPSGQVSRLTNALRLITVLATAWVGFASWKKLETAPLWGTLLLMSLGCATLYLLLPGAKSRYAVYTFLAFVPLVLRCFAAKRLGHKTAYRGWCALIFACLLLTTSLIPSSLRLYGVGLLGPLILWGVNLEFLMRLKAKRPRYAMLNAAIKGDMIR